MAEMMKSTGHAVHYILKIINLTPSSGEKLGIYFTLEKQQIIITSYTGVTVNISSVLLKKSFHKGKTTSDCSFFIELLRVGL